ncbi:MAG: hypothetical protein ABFQ95_06330 [Pseudomonadota bacterium]
MKINTDKINNFIQELSNKERCFYKLGLGSFFGELIDPNFNPETDDLDTDDIEECLNDQQQMCLYPVALEFFLSNDYPDPETEDLWNAIDAFIKRCGNALTTDEKKYYQGMRSSYMSLYEVVDIDVGKSLTLRDMMQGNSAPIKVLENKATQHIAKWDVLGVRLVKMGKRYVLAGGLLLLEKDCIDDLIENIKRIDAAVMQRLGTQDDAAYTELMLKKLWVKLIAEYWLEFSMQPDQETQLFNRDGDNFKLCTMTFPLKAAASKVAAKLNSLEKLKIDDEDRHWIWVEEGHPHNDSFEEKEDSDNKKVFVDTKIQAWDGAAVYNLYADFKLKNKQLIVEVNSEQRATIVEFFLKENLGKMIAEPELDIQLPERISEIANKEPGSEARGVSEAEIAVVHAMMDQHYRQWIDSKLPVLDNKSPRAMVKTKEGRKTVISLLKELENLEDRNAKTTPEQKYDFGWLFEELGIKSSEL